jgi:hypothetical protein
MIATLGKVTSIRKATIEDLEWLLQELKTFSAFIDCKTQVFNEDYGRAMFPLMLDKHVVFIAESEGERLGFIAGLLTPHPFNPNIKILQELFWWVSEQHRRSRAGLMLLNTFIEEGKRLANWTIMSLESNSPVREETLLRRGFRLKERAYILEE